MLCNFQTNDVVLNERDWIVVRPDINEPTGNRYTISHALEGLTPGKYTAVVRSKNTQGWSQPSEHKFEGGKNHQ